MKIKCLAFIDLIGTGKGFREGNAETILQNYWQALETWASQSLPPVKIEGANSVAVPRFKISSFSDSAVFWTKDEHGIRNFYNFTKSLLSSLRREGSICYAAINRDSYVPPSIYPAMGGRLINNDMMPAYYNAVGSGKAWINLFYANNKIEYTKEWHSEFHLYCVGENSLLPGAIPKDKREFLGFQKNKEMVYALE
jgi:hypothetical protein